MYIWWCGREISEIIRSLKMRCNLPHLWHAHTMWLIISAAYLNGTSIPASSPPVCPSPLHICCPNRPLDPCAHHTHSYALPTRFQPIDYFHTPHPWLKGRQEICTEAGKCINHGTPTFRPIPVTQREPGYQPTAGMDMGSCDRWRRKCICAVVEGCRASSQGAGWITGDRRIPPYEKQYSK